MRLLVLLSLFLLTTCSPALSKRNILVIGDSNGAGKGWVYQFQELRGGYGRVEEKYTRESYRLSP